MKMHEELRAKAKSGRKVLAPYVCAGFPELEATLPVLEALSLEGADCIELGVPFSDPLADGPVIQRASARARQNGMTLSMALEMAGRFTAANGTPLLLMSYLNPVLRMGAETFARRARAANVSACIIPDLPLEKAGMLAGSPPLVQFAAPNGSEERLGQIRSLDPPFVYCVAVMGVTGARSEVEGYTAGFLQRTKRTTALPCLAGFGVSNPEQAASLARYCDGVIVGSALARVLEECESPQDAARAAAGFIKPFRKALDEARTDDREQGGRDASGN